MKFFQTLGFPKLALAAGLATASLFSPNEADAQKKTARAQKLEENQRTQTEQSTQQENHHTYNLQSLTIQYDYATRKVMRMQAYGWKQNDDGSIDHLKFELAAEPNGAVGPTKNNLALKVDGFDFQDPSAARAGLNTMAHVSFNMDQFILASNQDQPAFIATHPPVVGAANTMPVEMIDKVTFSGDVANVIMLDANGQLANNPVMDANALVDDTSVYGLIITNFNSTYGTQYENNAFGTIPGQFTPAPPQWR